MNREKIKKITQDEIFRGKHPMVLKIINKIIDNLTDIQAQVEINVLNQDDIGKSRVIEAYETYRDMQGEFRKHANMAEMIRDNGETIKNPYYFNILEAKSFEDIVDMRQKIDYYKKAERLAKKYMRSYFGLVQDNGVIPTTLVGKLNIIADIEESFGDDVDLFRDFEKIARYDNEDIHNLIDGIILKYNPNKDYIQNIRDSYPLEIIYEDEEDLIVEVCGTDGVDDLQVPKWCINDDYYFIDYIEENGIRCGTHFALIKKNLIGTANPKRIVGVTMHGNGNYKASFDYEDDYVSVTNLRKLLSKQAYKEMEIVAITNGLDDDLYGLIDEVRDGYAQQYTVEEHQNNEEYYDQFSRTLSRLSIFTTDLYSIRDIIGEVWGMDEHRDNLPKIIDEYMFKGLSSDLFDKERELPLLAVTSIMRNLKSFRDECETSPHKPVAAILYHMVKEGDRDKLLRDEGFKEMIEIDIKKMKTDPEYKNDFEKLTGNKPKQKLASFKI